MPRGVAGSTPSGYAKRNTIERPLLEVNVLSTSCCSSAALIGHGPPLEVCPHAAGVRALPPTAPAAATIVRSTHFRIPPRGYNDSAPRFHVRLKAPLRPRFRLSYRAARARALMSTRLWC